mmetsp:Transcript_41156/g.117077  ORF Transcript_41156/g.117077 Transcript_41156/m.117077 type:complete len:96 (-) Transcript_41156:219-506(-)
MCLYRKDDKTHVHKPPYTAVIGWIITYHYTVGWQRAKSAAARQRPMERLLARLAKQTKAYTHASSCHPSLAPNCLSVYLTPPSLVPSSWKKVCQT